MAFPEDDTSIRSYTAYDASQLYRIDSSRGLSASDKAELEVFNPDADTLQRHHDFLIALWETGVIYISEIADYQIATRRESSKQVKPLDCSPFREEAYNNAQKRLIN